MEEREAELAAMDSDGENRLVMVERFLEPTRVQQSKSHAPLSGYPKALSH